MPTLDFESDPQLIALTDALRAGPGSAQWRDAVNRLREQGGDQGDEYLLLCTARERLASGRGYREVHAGPGFSRKVMQAVEEEQSGRPSRVTPTAGIIALLSAILVVAVVGTGGYVLWRSSGAQMPPAQDLSRVYFTEPVLDVQFDAAPPSGWRDVGALPLRFEKGLRPGDAPPAGADSAGGALVWEQSVLPSKPMQVEVDVRLPSPDSRLAVQVFVTDDPSLNEARATSPREVAWTYLGGLAHVVLPSGRVEASPFKPVAKQQALTVRLQFDAQSVAIDTAGKRLWAGGHGLDPAKPRFIGVRFLAPAGEKADPLAAFQSIQLKKPRP